MGPLTLSRYLALIFALLLGVMEAVLNSAQPHWQYAPLWIIDYVIVLALLAGFWLTRRARHAAVLMSAWALATGVFYMALFVSLDPEIPGTDQVPAFFLFLVGLGLGVQLLGLALAALAYSRAAR